MATGSPTDRTYRLRSTADLTGIEIDRKAGVIRNVAVLSEGPAEGHAFAIDRVTLDQFASKAPKTAPMRWTHPMPWDDALGLHVGHVENLRRSGNQIRGDVRFGPHARNVPGKGDVTAYLLDLAEYDPTAYGLSAVIRGDIEEKGEASMLRIREVLGVDLVDKPAANPDGLLSAKPSAGTLPAAQRLTERSSNMDATPNTAQPAAEKAGETAAAATVQTLEAKPETADALAAETRRVNDIRRLAKLYDTLPAGFAEEQIACGATLQEAMQRARICLAEKNQFTRTTVQVGDDRARVAMKSYLVDAILLHAGVKLAAEQIHPRAQGLAGHTLVDIIRHGLRGIGVDDAFELSRNQVIDLLNPHRLRQRYPMFLAQSTNDFDNLMVNALTKSLNQAYALAPSTWQLWARRGTIPDFKAANRVILSDAPVLVSRAEGGEVKYYSVTDHKETVTLVEYAAGIKLTRQAIINDDLNAFDRIPQMQANSARQKEDDVAYGIITGNASMGSPAAALFHGTHANLVSATASVGAPTVALIATTASYMMKQTSLKGAYLNLMPRFMLVPTELYITAKQLVASTVDPAKYNNTPNPFNDLIVVGNARLSANSAYYWYLLADNAVIDTVEVDFLADEPAPVVKQETDFATDDQKFAVRHTVAAGALDFRGMVRNNGA